MADLRRLSLVMVARRYSLYLTCKLPPPPALNTFHHKNNNMPCGHTRPFSWKCRHVQYASPHRVSQLTSAVSRTDFCRTWLGDFVISLAPYAYWLIICFLNFKTVFMFYFQIIMFWMQIIYILQTYFIFGANRGLSKAIEKYRSEIRRIFITSLTACVVTL